MTTLFSVDGRILTPPKHLEPLLKGAYPAFFKALGHIRFFYVADEIWDGKATLVFKSGDEKLAAITLDDGVFHMSAAGYDFRITGDHALNDVFDALDKTAAAGMRRPKEQLDADLDEYPSGIRCDLCLVNKVHNRNDFSGSEKFNVMTRHCYYTGDEDWGDTDYSKGVCEGKQGCYKKTFICFEEKGFKNCLECGEYRTCGNCGVGHDPGECNLGITAEEVTNLIIPYCEMERLDLLQKSGNA
ncbi:MAG: hypothetical protein FWE91_08300 [Defluviitaleaceae bacterium]|nr:hypothetical protein [Defluviitaleaceae bacterium]MCL2835312.1 hypothetical protein [Defluviitaleaceae bacterium]